MTTTTAQIRLLFLLLFFHLLSSRVKGISMEQKSISPPTSESTHIFFHTWPDGQKLCHPSLAFFLPLSAKLSIHLHLPPAIGKSFCIETNYRRVRIPLSFSNRLCHPLFRLFLVFSKRSTIF